MSKFLSKTDFEELERYQPPAETIIRGTDLQDRTPRTLLYGYDTARRTFHVYLDTDERIKVTLYATRCLIRYDTEDTIYSNAGYIPDKRLYPESCDLEFVKKIKDAGLSLPFTTFNQERADTFTKSNKGLFWVEDFIGLDTDSFTRNNSAAKRIGF